MAKTHLQSKIKINTDIKEPPLYKVIYINDDVTTMSFVMESLINHFEYSEDTAINITEDIHANGYGVVAILPFEIAEQKQVQVISDARKAKYPLKVRLESEES